ncbi:MAG TPA: hypothetical protein VE954_20390 [Oligoflexus sp.]|uniref:hypothetical protein n=1 Tax=Oligoflexus sp. TaxID=1971216 RepID=UPI002D539C26|nr:hypothetical protein [Oligoflexus sp.]HYX35461.1 hypothetical protein [Oligoflexus sp.]
MEVLVTVLGALIATLVMASVMYAMIWDGFEHGDMIRLLGSDITQQPRRYFVMGMFLYLGTGLALSWLYYKALNVLKFDSVIISAGLGGFMGFVQGFVLMYFYILELGSRHPNEQFKTHWLPLSFAHWFGHMVFGMALGSIIASYLIYGPRGFLISALVNILIAGGVGFFAKKSEIRALMHRQRQVR